MTGRKQFDPDQALDRALTIFWRTGYTGTSINDLLTATGLSRASLYATFGDKEQLFLACLHRYVHTVGDASQAALNQPGSDIRAQVQAGFDAVLDRMADPTLPAGCLLAQTAAEAGALAPSIRAAIAGLLEQQKAQMRRLLSAHQSVVGIPDPKLSSLASYLVTVAQALAVMHRAGSSVDDLRESVRHAMCALDSEH